MRDNEMFVRPTELALTSEQAKEAVLMLQKGYKKEDIATLLENEDNYIAENIIVLYLYYINHSNYQAIIDNYKLKFIDNEALVEPGVTIEERLGLAQIYDYISSYDFVNKQPNIFVDALKIHCLLYSACPYPEFGGKLREQPVVLAGSTHDVITAEEARRIFQSYLTKKYTINEDSYLDYLDEIIKDTVDLIKIQPFRDGNKRTFRSLLNLLLGRIGIPPVYVELSERDVYHKALFLAIEKGDYSQITRFYYYKICDAIVDLDLMKSMKIVQEKRTSFVMK